MITRTDLFSAFGVYNTHYIIKYKKEYPKLSKVLQGASRHVETLARMVGNSTNNIGKIHRLVNYYNNKVTLILLADAALQNTTITLDAVNSKLYKISTQCTLEKRVVHSTMFIWNYVCTCSILEQCFRIVNYFILKPIKLY